MSIRLALATMLALWLGGCGGEPPASPAQEIQLSRQTTAFGLPTELSVRATSEAQAEAALHSAIEDLHYVAEISHPWQPGALARTNELLSLTGTFSANPSGLPLIEQASELYRQSEGHFNPAMGRLQRLWGFHQQELDFVLPAAPAEIIALLDAAPTMADIEVNGIRIRSRNPQVQLDYGPFAHGYGLDIARQRLLEAGITRAQLHSGHARVQLGAANEAVTLSPYPALQLTLQAGEALYTVTTLDRFYELDGQRIHNHLNPHTGYPANGISALSVIHPSAASAAALAQALLVAGTERLPALAARMGVSLYLLQTDDGRLLASPALRQRLSTSPGVIELVPGV